MLRGKFVVLNVYIRNEERSKIKNLSFHFRKLREKRNLNLVQTEEKIIKIRAEINETGKMKTIEKINKSKS